MLNIIYDSVNDEFLLIDFECSGKNGEPISAELKTYPENWLEGVYKYEIKDDLYLFGLLINELESLFERFSDDINNLGKQLLEKPESFIQIETKTEKKSKKIRKVTYSFMEKLK